MCFVATSRARNRKLVFIGPRLGAIAVISIWREITRALKSSRRLHVSPRSQGSVRTGSGPRVRHVGLLSGENACGVKEIVSPAKRTARPRSFAPFGSTCLRLDCARSRKDGPSCPLGVDIRPEKDWGRAGRPTWRILKKSSQLKSLWLFCMLFGGGYHVSPGISPP